MILCPKCGAIANFNSYFGAYMCSECSWVDDSYNKNRIYLFNKSICSDSKEETSGTTKYKRIGLQNKILALK